MNRTTFPRTVPPVERPEGPKDRDEGREKLRGFGRVERWVLGALLMTTALGTAGVLGSKWDVARRKRALRTHIEREREVVPERAKVLVDAMDRVLLDATLPWQGDHVDPELATADARRAFLARSAVYVRAALPEIARLDAIGGAVRRSDKDAFVLCLRKPPADDSAAALEEAATRHWMGGGLFEDATHDVMPLDVVHKGLRPLSPAFAAELDEANDHLYVRRLEEEYQGRSAIALLMARTAASSDLLVAVVDELPAGMTEPEVGKSLTATRRPAILPLIEDSPHAVRVVVWSAEKRAVVLRMRTFVDATHLTLKQNLGMVAAHVQACQAAVALQRAGVDR